uniref:Lipopolysaccharide biosynthesis protein n=1 Tax=Rhodopseudomonas palustris (strain DX-1) TaxID=652103 RepID=E6VE08_RHOPX
MPVSPTASDKAPTERREVSASWQGVGGDARGAAEDGLSVARIAGFLLDNARRIAAAAAVLFALGIVGLWLVPAKYAATALVIVDPREQRVTPDQEVLPGIGQDAAALQSLVEIAKSDGFLEPLIDKLKVADDYEISGGETDRARVLEKFRKHLEIARRGLTYVIAMTFVSKDPQRAADYANAIASAFVASQTNTRTVATDDAAAWLNSRLKTLSDKLRASEDAIAAFKTQYRIVDAGKESTTRQLRVTELTQQVSAARLQVEEARGRYEQAQRDLKSDVDGSTGSKSDLLTALRAQLNQLNDQIAQKRAVLGDRHPDLVMSYNQLAELKRQIEVERRRNVANAKSDYEALLDKQKTLEAQLKQLEGDMLTDAQAAVKLQELQREADANRAIYEQFLARYNATNQQRLLQATQTKVASLATPPSRSTRPPLSLMLAVLAIVSLLGGVGFAVVMDRIRPRAGGDEDKVENVASQGPAAAEVASDPHPISGGAAIPPPTPITSRPRPPGPPDVSAAGAAVQPGFPDIPVSVQRILDTIGVKTSDRGRVVLVTSADAASGGAVARALNQAAVDRGLLSVVVEVAPDSAALQAGSAAGRSAAVRTLKTSVRSLLRLLSAAPDDAAQDDIRSEFDLVLIDAPSPRACPEVAQLAAHTDYNLLAVGAISNDPGAIQHAQASLSRFGRAPIATVTNQIGGRPAAERSDTRLAG